MNQAGIIWIPDLTQTAPENFEISDKRVLQKM